MGETGTLLREEEGVLDFHGDRPLQFFGVVDDVEIAVAGGFDDEMDVEAVAHAVLVDPPNPFDLINLRLFCGEGAGHDAPRPPALPKGGEFGHNIDFSEAGVLHF